ncbi:hypothetical protein MKJ04_03585 [Pontibacter sp. E15-1]|uniref:hypothetical protein n=1 Tax=Pontibacter sp. E15-1 TaxID=2919918 RepID=UPI001F4FEC0A|nr:hypothetical protein [Pontibacter sp. E15-1]MCJ8163909.1 hypothetical protein [Pontibacter sp. E15-1]
MEENQLSDLLSSYDKRIRQANAFSLQAVESLQMQKSKSVLNGLFYKLLIELAIGLAFTSLLALFIYNNLGSLPLVLAAAVIMVFTIIAVSGCIRQIMLLSTFDYSRDIAQNQRTLASLQTHIITYLRLAILQLPFYFAYILIGFKLFFGVNIWQVGDTAWLISQAVISVAFVPVAWWLYRKISYRNLHIGWVKALVAGSGGKSVTKAMEFLREIDRFQHS